MILDLLYTRILDVTWTFWKLYRDSWMLLDIFRCCMDISGHYMEFRDVVWILFGAAWTFSDSR